MAKRRFKVTFTEEIVVEGSWAGSMRELREAIGDPETVWDLLGSLVRADGAQMVEFKGTPRLESIEIGPPTTDEEAADD